MTKVRTLVGAPEPPGHQPTQIYSHMLAALCDITHLTRVLSEGVEPSTKAGLEAIASEAVGQINRQGVSHDC